MPIACAASQQQRVSSATAIGSVHQPHASINVPAFAPSPFRRTRRRSSQQLGTEFGSKRHGVIAVSTQNGQAVQLVDRPAGEQEKATGEAAKSSVSQSLQSSHGGPLIAASALAPTVLAPAPARTSLSSVSETEDEDEEAGGCKAVWDHNFWDHPSPVRAHLLEVDPGLNQKLISSGTTVAQIFNQDMWERHRAPGRYLLYMKRMLHSTVLRRIFHPCLAATAVGAIVCALNAVLPPQLPRLAMSLVPHTLLGAALSLLLVFRTNSAYARFCEGRALWGSLVRHSRDWTRLAMTHFPPEIRGRAARYIQVLAFVLKSHLRSGRTRASPNDPTAFKDDPTTVVEELLPCSEAEEVLEQQNRPYFVICRMTALAREAAAAGVPRHVMHQLEHTLSEICAVVGGCDRILGTPIPLSYTRHTSRSLVLWLSTLPIALWPVTAWITIPAMFIISFIFVGIDEIAVEIEEPFCILPLLPLCRTIVQDVAIAHAAVEAC